MPGGGDIPTGARCVRTPSKYFIDTSPVAYALNEAEIRNPDYVIDTQRDQSDCNSVHS
jgi:hypothetical protein